MNKANVSDIVCREIARILQASGNPPVKFGGETSLVGDLAFDSLNFVDLTVALEDALDISEFPMQAWVDHEATKKSARFTVASLVMACLAHLPRGT